MVATTPGLAGQEKLAELASRFVQVDDLPWKDTPWEGITIKMLMQDRERGLETALIKWEPGAVLPRHEHIEIEQTYVLEGSFGDEEGVVTAGNFVWRPAGSSHTVASKDGALMLAFFLKPNRFFDVDTPVA